VREVIETAFARAIKSKLEVAYRGDLLRTGKGAGDTQVQRCGSSSTSSLNVPAPIPARAP
jgi:hypothetical protein